MLREAERSGLVHGRTGSPRRTANRPYRSFDGCVPSPEDRCINPPGGLPSRYEPTGEDARYRDCLLRDVRTLGKRPFRLREPAVPGVGVRL